MAKIALVAGVTGMVGRRLARHLATRDGWRVIGLSRRTAVDDAHITQRSLDLEDSAACSAPAPDLSHVTHAFYAARATHDETGHESVDANTRMLANFIDMLERHAPRLQHVHVVHGTKYYGMHHGPFKTPAAEDDPRSVADNFYYTQQDLLIERQAAAAWTWTISRPHVIYDADPSVTRNIVLLLGWYATISKALGLPLSFPGAAGHFSSVSQLIDARLLARAIEWIATTPAAANNAFNVTNGDVFRWQNVWPRIADYFEMEAGPVRTIDMAAAMASREDLRRRIVREHGLADRPIPWRYGDWLLRTEFDIMLSMTKARRIGFREFIDTENALFELFDEFRALNALP